MEEFGIEQLSFPLRRRRRNITDNIKYPCLYDYISKGIDRVQYSFPIVISLNQMNLSVKTVKALSNTGLVFPS